MSSQDGNLYNMDEGGVLQRLGGYSSSIQRLQEGKLEASARIDAKKTQMAETKEAQEEEGLGIGIGSAGVFSGVVGVVKKRAIGMIKSKAKEQLEQLTNKIKARATTEPEQPDEPPTNTTAPPPEPEEPTRTPQEQFNYDSELHENGIKSSANRFGLSEDEVRNMPNVKEVAPKPEDYGLPPDTQPQPTTTPAPAPAPEPTPPQPIAPSPDDLPMARPEPTARQPTLDTGEPDITTQYIYSQPSGGGGATIRIDTAEPQYSGGSGGRNIGDIINQQRAPQPVDEDAITPAPPRAPPPPEPEQPYLAQTQEPPTTTNVLGGQIEEAQQTAVNNMRGSLKNLGMSDDDVSGLVGKLSGGTDIEDLLQTGSSILGSMGEGLGGVLGFLGSASEVLGPLSAVAGIGMGIYAEVKQREEEKGQGDKLREYQGDLQTLSGSTALQTGSIAMPTLDTSQFRTGGIGNF